MSLEALGVGQGLDGNSQLSLAVLEIVTFHDADAACIAVNEAFIPMKPVCCCVQLMRVGSSASNGVDQARCGFNSNGGSAFQRKLACPWPPSALWLRRIWLFVVRVQSRWAIHSLLLSPRQRQSKVQRRHKLHFKPKARNAGRCEDNRGLEGLALSPDPHFSFAMPLKAVISDGDSRGASIACS
jgi:hypothetical protein